MGVGGGLLGGWGGVGWGGGRSALLKSPGDGGESTRLRRYPDTDLQSSQTDTCVHTRPHAQIQGTQAHVHTQCSFSTYLCTQTHTCAPVSACPHHSCTSACVNVWAPVPCVPMQRACSGTHTGTRIYTRTCAHAYPYTHTHTHMSVHIPISWKNLHVTIKSVAVGGSPPESLVHGLFPYSPLSHRNPAGSSPGIPLLWAACPEDAR